MIKKIILVSFIMIPSIVFAQDKYAVIFSKLSSAAGEEKVIARNNFNLVYKALLVQQFKKEHIIYDTTHLTRKIFINQILSLKSKIKLNDFVLFYFDLPWKEDSLTGTPKLILNQHDLTQNILISELRDYIKKGLQPGDDSLQITGGGVNGHFYDRFFALFEGNAPPHLSNYSLEMDYCFATVPGQQSQIINQSGLFTQGLARALSEETSFLTTTEDFCNTIDNKISLNTSKQNIFFQYYYGNYDDYGNTVTGLVRKNKLFNGNFKRFPVHFIIQSKSTDTRVTINAGENLNVSPGATVKFYKAFTDTSKQSLLAEGIVDSTSAFTSFVHLREKLVRPVNSIWAYVFESDGKESIMKVNFNTLFPGNSKMLDVFNGIMKNLSSDEIKKYLNFVENGGDLQISDISKNSSNNYTITLANPVSGLIYDKMAIEVGNRDISNIFTLIKQHAKFKYLSRIRNYVPELQVDFEMVYADTHQKVYKENGFDIIFDRDRINIRIINKEPVALYYALIDLQPDWIAKVILPGILGSSGNSRILPFDSILLKDIIILPPFGIERFKIITSYQPIDPEGFQDGSIASRGTGKSSFNPELFNIRDFDFEIRNRIFAKEDTSARNQITTSVFHLSSDSSNNVFSSTPPEYEQKVPPPSMPIPIPQHPSEDSLSLDYTTDRLQSHYTNYTINNPSAGAIFFNLLKQQSDGGFYLLLPDSFYNSNDCYVKKSQTFKISSPLKPLDQLITVFSDRPFDLSNYTKEGKSINELLVNIIKEGKIPGTPINKIRLKQELYSPADKTVSRDNGEPVIRLITPKIGDDRGIKVSVDEQNYTINGFAIGRDNTPVKKILVNNKEIFYDAALKFFEDTLALEEGTNRVVIEATNESGFTSSKIFEIDLQKTQVVVPAKGKNYFLGIGINNYATWPHLNNAEKDVKDFADLIEKKFGFDVNNVDLVLDSNATRKNIINKIRLFLKNSAPNDNIIIYLSGHGNEDQLADGGYYFIPQDADKDDVTTAVNSSDIINNFRSIKARHCLLIIDACYSGMITNNSTPSNSMFTPSDTDIPLEEQINKWIITSGRATKVSDGGTNSPFASAMLNYLRENNDESKLTISQLILYLQDEVPKMNTPQIPFGQRIEGKGEMIFKVITN